MAIGVLKAFLKAAALYLAIAQSGELVFPDGDIVAVHKICKRQPRQVLRGAAGKKAMAPLADWIKPRPPRSALGTTKAIGMPASAKALSLKSRVIVLSLSLVREGQNPLA